MKKLQEIFREANRELTRTEQDQVKRIKEKAMALAVEFNPTDTREKGIALMKLEETVMWAVKGVTA